MCVCVCVYVYGILRWQQSKKGGGNNKMDDFTSRSIYYVGYSP